MFINNMNNQINFKGFITQVTSDNLQQGNFQPNKIKDTSIEEDKEVLEKLVQEINIDTFEKDRVSEDEYSIYSKNSLGVVSKHGDKLDIIKNSDKSDKSIETYTINLKELPIDLLRSFYEKVRQIQKVRQE